jgi:hypothetical protein
MMKIDKASNKNTKYSFQGKMSEVFVERERGPVFAQLLQSVL